MKTVSVLCVLLMLLVSPSIFVLQANAQCEQSGKVAQFNISPATIVGDGIQAATGNYTTDNGTPGVQLMNAFSPTCMPPSYWAGDTQGCSAVNGSATIRFSGTIAQQTTYDMVAKVVPPYAAGGCPDPGKHASLTVTVPPGGPPALPDGGTPDPICGGGGSNGDDGGNDKGGGESCSVPKAGEPINLLNGNTWIEHRDYALPGLGGGLEITRTWNSSWPNLIVWPGGPTMDLSGMFGHSWRSTYEERLQTLTNGITKYWRANGNSWFFTYDSVNQVYVLTDPVNERGTLAFDSGSTQYTLTFKNGAKRIFNNAGRLIAIKDRRQSDLDHARWLEPHHPGDRRYRSRHQFRLPERDFPHARDGVARLCGHSCELHL